MAADFERRTASEGDTTRKPRVWGEEIRLGGAPARVVPAGAVDAGQSLLRANAFVDAPQPAEVVGALAAFGWPEYGLALTVAAEQGAIDPETIRTVGNAHEVTLHGEPAAYPLTLVGEIPDDVACVWPALLAGAHILGNGHDPDRYVDIANLLRETTHGYAAVADVWGGTEEFRSLAANGQILVHTREGEPALRFVSAPVAAADVRVAGGLSGRDQALVYEGPLQPGWYQLTGIGEVSPHPGSPQKELWHQGWAQLRDSSGRSFRLRADNFVKLFGAGADAKPVRAEDKSWPGYEEFGPVRAVVADLAPAIQ